MRDEHTSKPHGRKEGLRNGTYSDDGPPAPTTADDVLIATCREALTMLEARPSPNGIGTCSTDMREVARIIRNAAEWTWLSFRRCGAICTDGDDAATCECEEHEEADRLSAPLPQSTLLGTG